MAKTEEKQPFVSNVSPIREPINEEPNDTNDYFEEDTVSTSGCFKLCCFQWKQNRDGENRSLLGEQQRETWFVKKLKKLKEGSELLAGPKWKNFIRKIGKLFNNNKKKKSRTLFQYDPQSYALNFDDGKIDDGEEDDELLFGFSTRFAPPLSAEERRAGL